MTQQSHYWSYTLRLSISVVSYSLWPIDCSLAGSSVHGISQARIWVAISFSRRSSWPGSWPCISCIGRQILYCWSTKEAHSLRKPRFKRTLVPQCSFALLIHRNTSFLLIVSVNFLACYLEPLGVDKCPVSIRMTLFFFLNY